MIIFCPETRKLSCMNQAPRFGQVSAKMHKYKIKGSFLLDAVKRFIQQASSICVLHSKLAIIYLSWNLFQHKISNELNKVPMKPFCHVCGSGVLKSKSDKQWTLWLASKAPMTPTENAVMPCALLWCPLQGFPERKIAVPLQKRKSRPDWTYIYRPSKPCMFFSIEVHITRGKLLCPFSLRPALSPALRCIW